MNPYDIYAVDRAMIKADGTKDKSKLGANAILAVSIACARASALSLGIPLFKFIGGINSTVLPVPMMNILNGGAHLQTRLTFREYDYAQRALLLLPKDCAGVQKSIMLLPVF